MAITEIQLEQLVRESSDNPGWEWFGQKIAKMDEISADLSELDIMLAMARRKVGVQYLYHTEYAHWNCADAVRILMLLKASRAFNTDVLSRAYKLGDEYEKEAILKGLYILDPEGLLVSLAVDACRTNMESMMRAIALQNAYPNRFFSEHAFNQMVLKCLFMGFNISYVSGIETRTNPALSRMSFDYCQERLAAGRDFPESLWLAIRVQDIQESRTFFLQYLNNYSDQHRYYVVQSLITSAASDSDTTIVNALKTRLQCESNSRVRQLITDFI